MNRREYVLSTLLAGLAASAHAQQPQTTPRMALVVGNWAYKTAPLTAPQNDVIAMSNALQNLGFAVQQASNLTQPQFLDKVVAFARQVAQADALAIIYLTGQGVSLLGESVRFVGVGSEIKNTADAYRQSTDLAWILSTMAAQQRTRQKRSPIVLIADIASDEPFAAPSAKSTAQNKTLTETLERERGTFVLLASYPGTVAQDANDKPTGLMTKHLLAALQTDGLSLSQIDTRVRAAVRRESTLGQIPFSVSTDVDDEKIFFKTTVLRDDAKVRGRVMKGG